MAHISSQILVLIFQQRGRKSLGTIGSKFRPDPNVETQTLCAWTTGVGQTRSTFLQWYNFSRVHNYITQQGKHSTVAFFVTFEDDMVVVVSSI
jgi:hypothetical protein